MPQEFAQWKVGDVILDLYQVADTLGEGRFAQVYKVTHRDWKIDLAVKIPKPSVVAAAGGIEQFNGNLESWVKLGLHPHIVSCYYIRRLNDVPLVFTEYVPSGSLRDWIDSRQLYIEPREGDSEKTSLKRILDIAIQFAWGLHYAHEQKLIHQNVNPSNVAIAPNGTAKVTDFGVYNPQTLPAILDGESHDLNLPLSLDGTGVEAGITPPLLVNSSQHDAAKDSTSGNLMLAAPSTIILAYCSPEQANGETPTRYTDLWSWALCVLEMFQGVRTWTSGILGSHALKYYLQNGPVDRQLPQMPVQVSLLLGRCFRANPDDRPRNMLEVANELVRIYWQVTETAYPRWEPQPGKNIADILNNRAMSLLDVGVSDEASQLWDQALYMQQPHPESTYNRGLMLWRSARMSDDTFVRELEDVEKANSENWGCLYLLALAHLERDDCSAALLSLDRCPPRVAKIEVISRTRREARSRYQASLSLSRTFEGHTSSVNSVCLSADSQFALSGSNDNTLKLWEVATGCCLRTFEGHTDNVRSICFSGDAQLALSGSQDGLLKFWDVTTGNCLYTFEGHPESVTSVCLSVDGRFALSGSADYTLKLWDVANRQWLLSFEEHTAKVNSICLSEDALFALSASDDKTIKLWEVQTGRCLYTFKGHLDTVNSISLSKNAQFLLSGSNDKTVKLWEVLTGRCLATFEGHADEVLSVSLSGDVRFALSASQDNTLKLWDVRTGRCLRTFEAALPLVNEGVDGGVNFVCLSPDSHFALSGNPDNTLKMWALNSWSNPYVAPMMLSPLTATAIVQSISIIYDRTLDAAHKAIAIEEYAVAAGHIRKARSLPGFSRNRSSVNIWMQLYSHLPRKALTSGWACAILYGHTQWVNSVCLSRDARLALSGSYDQTLKLWDAVSGRCLRTFEGHAASVNSVCLSEDARLALSGSEDDTLKLWEVDTGRCLLTLQGNTRGVYSVCLSKNARFALAGTDNNTLNLWDLATGECLRTFEGHRDRVNSVCLSADGLLALSCAGTSDKTIKLWEVASARCLRTFEGHARGVNSVCLSPDGKFAISGSQDSTLKQWEVATGQCLRTFEGHKRGVNSVCLSSDARFALSGSYDNTLKLWDVATGDCVRTFAGHNFWVTSVFLSSDAGFALSGSYDNTLKLWALDWELEI